MRAMARIRWEAYAEVEVEEIVHCSIVPCITGEEMNDSNLSRNF
jgi:hypothetical protein